MKLKLLGATIALSVATLLTGCGEEETTLINGDANVGEALDYTITGIEPGAGMMGLAADTLVEYENLGGWEILESSTAGMLTELDQAIRNEEPIIVAGWTPHYKFATHDLKFLDDPKGVFGGEEDINTIVRIGLEEDMPNAFKVLDRFYWETDDMEAVMLAAQEQPFEEVAQTWIEENADRVLEWTEGVEMVDGKAIELVLTPWDTERASAHVMEAILEGLGYDVTLTPVDPALMFQAIANGEGDASLAPWLPLTHGAFFEEHRENIIDLGPNLTGTRVGYVVPAYMDIDSIEDLPANE